MVSNYYAERQEARNALQSVAFSSHWAALGVFTGQYIRVATQIPLLRAKAVFGWFPYLLYILIAATCAFFVYAGFFINNAS